MDGGPASAEVALVRRLCGEALFVEFAAPSPAFVFTLTLTLPFALFLSSPFFGPNARRDESVPELLASSALAVFVDAVFVDAVFVDVFFATFFSVEAPGLADAVSFAVESFRPVFTVPVFSAAPDLPAEDAFATEFFAAARDLVVVVADFDAVEDDFPLPGEFAAFAVLLSLFFVVLAEFFLAILLRADAEEVVFPAVCSTVSLDSRGRGSSIMYYGLPVRSKHFHTEMHSASTKR